jgi:hypothetical protein
VDFLSFFGQERHAVAKFHRSIEILPFTISKKSRPVALANFGTSLGQRKIATRMAVRTLIQEF